MAAGDISLNILIGATDNASGVIAGLAGGGALGGVAVAALAAGTAVVGFGVASVQAAANFQQGMTTLVTGAGESASALGMVSQGILTMSVATGTSTQQLTSGMYMIESAGYHGAAGLQVLQAAAEGAKVGNADLGTVANATTTIMTDFGISSQNSSQAVNTLIATVANGKTTMGDLSGALSQVAPTAAAAGVSLTDMMGAMATMTGEGVPAANAATFLRQTIIALDAPSKQTVSALQAVGLSSTAVANEMKVSLPGALQMITDAVGKKFPVGSAAYVNALKDIAGGSKQMQGILDLTGIHLATFKQNVDNISLAVQKGGGSILGWTAVQGDFNTQMDRAKASVAALFIVVGTQLLPILTPMVSAITTAIGSFTQWVSTGNNLKSLMPFIIGGVAGLATIVLVAVVPAFLTWAAATLAATWPILLIAVAVAALVAGIILAYNNFTPFRVAVQAAGAALGGLANFFTQTEVGAAILKAILIVLAIAIGAIGIVILAVVIPAFIAWVAGAIAVGIANIIAFAPIILIILAIVAVIAVVILIIQNWGAIVGWLGGVWNAFTSWFMGALGALGSFFTGVWNGFLSLIQTVWNGIVSAITAAWNAVVAFLTNGLNATANSFQTVWNGIVSFLQGAWNLIISIVQTAINTVVGWFVWLYDHNYYFKDLVDFIVAVFTFLSSAISAIWTAITSFLSATWTAITSAVTAAWNAISAFLQATWTAISSATMAAWNAILAFLQGVWTAILGAATAAWNAILGAIQAAWAAISGAVTAAATAVMAFLQGIWNSIVSTVTGMWGQISGIFGSAWGTYIAGPLGGLASSIAGWFTGLVGQATQWGANLIQGFINGILSMLGAVGNAVGSILGKIGNLLGFHSPTKEGEGQHIIEWGQNMVKSFGEGIEAAAPMLHAQIEHLIQSPKLSYAKAAGSAFALSSSPVVHVHIEAAETKIHLDKREVGHAVMNFAAKEIRTQSGYRGR